MTRVEGEIIINRPVEEVFAFVADQRNEPCYNPQMRVAEKITAGDIGVGTRFRAETMSGNRQVEMWIEITSYEPPQRITQSTTMASMDLHGGLTFDSVPSGTCMHWAWDLEPRGILKVMGPLVAFIGRRQERRIWSSLKHFLEDQDEPVPRPEDKV